jgi:hypothetical protein
MITANMLVIGTRYLVLIIISFSILMPFLELSIIRNGFGLVEANIVNCIIILAMGFLLVCFKSSVSNALIVVLFYVVAKGLQGIVNGYPLPHVLISSASLLFVFTIYNYFISKNVIDLIWFLKRINILLLSLLILTSEVNYILFGHALPLLVQNLSLVILFTSVYLFYIEKKTGGGQTYIIAIIIGYIALLFARADNTANINNFLNGILQVKFFILALWIFMCYFLLLVFSSHFKKQTKFENRNYQFISIFFILSIIIFNYSFVLKEYSGLFYRNNSAYVRLLVNNAMLDEIHRWWSTVLFGYGVGSSWADYNLSAYTSRILKAPAHSGIYVFYYEHGLVGILLFIYTLYASIKQTPIIKYTEINLYNYYQISSYGALFMMKFVIVFWVSSNLVIISSMPGPNAFWNSGVVIYLLLWMTSLRIALPGKLKLKALK